MFLYDQHFNDSELLEIRKLRNLDSKRKLYSWLIGLIIFLVIFLAQIPFHGIEVMHALCTYGCIPAGVASGVYFHIKTDKYINSQFIRIWDPKYYQRSGTTPELIAARNEINRLIDSHEFMTKPIEEQKAIMKRINQKYGIGK